MKRPLFQTAFGMKERKQEITKIVTLVKIAEAIPGVFNLFKGSPSLGREANNFWLK